MGPEHLLSVHRQDDRLYSPWLEAIREKLEDGNMDGMQALGDGDGDGSRIRRLKGEFLDFGASRVSTMTSGYYNKDCWVMNLDDWFTTSGCMQDYENTVMFEFDVRWAPPQPHRTP